MTDPTPIDRLNERTARLRLKLTEAAVDFYATLGLLDPRDLQAELDGWGTFPVMAPPYYRQSQKRGEVLPVYTTEEQLRLLRDRSRKLRAENEFAICAVETRKSYVVGKGFVYRAAAAHKDCPASLLERVQKVLDWWDEANDLASYAADMMDRLDTDGESFTRFFPQKSGLVLLRPVEPEHVRSPQGDAYGPEFSFGVQTDPEDVEDVKGYWIVESPLYNPSPAFVPAGEVMHARLNVPRSAKRGLPTFYPVEQNLRRAEDLLGSMTSMAKTRAKIALIRKFNGLVKSTVQSMTDELTEATATDPSTGNAISLERLRFGTILNSSGGIDYEMPSADVQASDYVAVLQAELRAIASRLCMPEWMLTADASNANYSSSLVAEAPSTKMFERLQRQLARQLGESRERSRESAAWRQLRHAVRVGLLPREVYQLVKVQVEAPSLVVRDRAGEATMNAQYLQARIKSPQTIAAELGLDYEQEQHNFRAADKFKPKESPQGQGPAALGEAEERKDKSGHRYCVEPGHGRVDCADDGEGPADAGARGEGGLTPADSGTLSKLATLGQKVMSGTARLEHGAKEYITRQVAKLPAAIRKPVAGAYRLYFASYLAAEKAVEVVARERGLPEEKVKQVVKIVTVVDLVAGAKLVPGTLAAAGLGAFAAPAAFIPVGSLGYLAYSTARDPAATLRAARQAVQGLLAKLKGQNKEAEAAIDPLLVRALVRRAQLVSDLDQYAAYLLAALDETHGDAPLSLRIADQLAGLRPGRQQEVKIDRDSLGRRYCTDEQTGKRVDCPDDSKDTKDDSKGKVQKRQPPKPAAKGKPAGNGRVGGNALQVTKQEDKQRHREVVKLLGPGWESVAEQSQKANGKDDAGSTLANDTMANKMKDMKNEDLWLLMKHYAAAAKGGGGGLGGQVRPWATKAAEVLAQRTLGGTLLPGQAVGIDLTVSRSGKLTIDVNVKMVTGSTADNFKPGVAIPRLKKSLSARGLTSKEAGPFCRVAFVMNPKLPHKSGMYVMTGYNTGSYVARGSKSIQLADLPTLNAAIDSGKVRRVIRDRFDQIDWKQVRKEMNEQDQNILAQASKGSSEIVAAARTHGRAFAAKIAENNYDSLTSTPEGKRVEDARSAASQAAVTKAVRVFDRAGQTEKADQLSQLQDDLGAADPAKPKHIAKLTKQIEALIEEAKSLK